jgi:hypothetical protein
LLNIERTSAAVRFRLSVWASTRTAIPPGAFVDDLLELLAVAAAGRLVDRALDVVGGHVHRASLLDREAEPVVGIRVAATLPGGHTDLTSDLGEERAAPRVCDTLLALDRGPFGMT